MTNDDDQEWFDTLAGRADQPDAAALRKAIGARAVAGSDAPQRSSARESALVDRARREGLIPKARGSSMGSLFGDWLAGWRGALVMATVAGIAIFVGMSMRTPPVDETVRGSSVPSTMLYSDAPAELRARIVESLIDADVEAYGYSMQGLEYVDATLPDPVSKNIEQVLDGYGIAVPNGATLRVVIARRSR